MGARINFVFKDVEGEAHVVLYSHWGETEWQRDLAGALNHSRPRWTDYSYFTRMVVSYFLKDELLSETGFGIYSITGSNFELGETTVVVDISNNTVYEVGSSVKVDWDSFIKAYCTSRVSA